MPDQKNLFVAIIVSLAILLGWQFLIEKPRLEKEQAQRQAQQQAAQKSSPPAATGDAAVPAAPSAPGSGAAPAAVPAATVPGTSAGIAPPGADPAQARSAAVAQSPRIAVKSDSVSGSLRLAGARLDDLTLRQYRETIGPKSPLVDLLSPAGSAHPYHVEVGWVAEGKVAMPTADTPWRVVGANRELTPDQSVMLEWDNGAGLLFRRTLKLDREYMFTVSDSVENKTAEPVTLYPYGLVSRTGKPTLLGFYILHEGMIGVFDRVLTEHSYDDLKDKPRIVQQSTGGWLGITDKYWLVALIPPQSEKIEASFRREVRNAVDRYQSDFRGDAHVVAPGQSAQVETRVFAGAKRVDLLNRYRDELEIPRFDFAVDFGWFHFITRPLAWFLHKLHGYVGNYGIAIIIVTLLLKIAFFPLANKSYKAMSQMKKLQPELLALRDRFGNDKQRLNQEMMGLYRKHKVNPASGCLPIIVQIPVFFALYKVLFVTIEMRHAPFFGWIQDLSAPDPTTWLNLFGLIPWTPAAYIPASIYGVISLGVWPLIMGVTMWLQQKLNPAPADPIQAKVFAFLPIIFTFMLAQFPSGLVIYWCVNNVLSMAQQYVIMRRMGVAVGGGEEKKELAPVAAAPTKSAGGSKKEHRAKKG
ncbi:MAG: membrane protein insertase YidC [Alphaproteobacteria bacterium]|nr:membrane protein insertase YidC [Alphaproteobacteria bacterium]